MDETRSGTRLEAFVDSPAFTATVTAVVVVNAVVLGVATLDWVGESAQRALRVVDRACLLFFLAEMALKLAAYRVRFFASPWRIFDLTVVLVSLVPSAGPFSVLRVFRVMRMLRVVSVIKPLRRVVEALIRAIPGIGAILGVLAVFIYVGAVLTTTLFGEAHPALFGSLVASIITLFQLMLFDGWAGEVVRVVEETHPGAAVFFVAFTVLTGFAVLNLFIAVMVDALREEHDRLQDDELEQIERRQRGHQVELDHVEGAVRALEAKIDRLLAASGGPAEAAQEEGDGT